LGSTSAAVTVNCWVSVLALLLVPSSFTTAAFCPYFGTRSNTALVRPAGTSDSEAPLTTRVFNVPPAVSRRSARLEGG